LTASFTVKHKLVARQLFIVQSWCWRYGELRWFIV